MNEDKAAIFETWAARIRNVADGEFAGAFVVLPPGDDVKPLLMLSVEPDAQQSHFWLSVKGRVDAAFAEFSEKERSGGGYGRR